MTDITPEHEVKMRVAATVLSSIHGDWQDTLAGRAAVRQFVDIVRPELVILLLDMGNQMTDAVERIDQMVKSAGFDNLEQELKGIERIGKALHNAD